MRIIDSYEAGRLYRHDWQWMQALGRMGLVRRIKLKPVLFDADELEYFMRTASEATLSSVTPWLKHRKRKIKKQVKPALLVKSSRGRRPGSGIISQFQGSPEKTSVSAPTGGTGGSKELGGVHRDAPRYQGDRQAARG